MIKRNKFKMSSLCDKDYLSYPSQSWLERYELLANMSYPRAVVEDVIEPYQLQLTSEHRGDNREKGVRFDARNVGSKSRTPLHGTQYLSNVEDMEVNDIYETAVKAPSGTDADSVDDIVKRYTSSSKELPLVEERHTQNTGIESHSSDHFEPLPPLRAQMTYSPYRGPIQDDIHTQPYYGPIISGINDDINRISTQPGSPILHNVPNISNRNLSNVSDADVDILSNRYRARMAQKHCCRSKSYSYVDDLEVGLRPKAFGHDEWLLKKYENAVLHIEKQEANIKCLRMEVNSLTAAKKQEEMRISELQNEREHLKCDLDEARAQYKECAQELAHHDEKLMLMEQSLQTTQEQLRQHITEVVRYEQANRKLEMELKTLQDCNTNSEEEIEEQKTVIDKLRKDLMRAKEDYNAVVQEGFAYKQQAHKLEVELDGAKEQEKMLIEQVVQQDAILSQIQNELRSERDRHQETALHLQNARRTNSGLEDAIETNQKETKELSNKLIEKEELIKKLRGNVDDQGKCIQKHKEDVADRDAQLHVIKMNLQQQQKQTGLHEQEISRYEDTLQHLQTELEKSQDNYRKAHAQLAQNKEGLHDLKVQLAAVQGNHKESMEQLCDRSQQVALMKTEISHVQQHNQALTEELSQYEQKLRQLNQELKNMQDINRLSEQELKASEMKYNDLQQEIRQSQDRNHQSLQELSAKEEEIVAIRIELGELQEKYKLMCNETEKVLTDLEQMHHNYQSANEEIKGLRRALEESRTNGDRLHKESELVVQNVNTWVQEQKHANEKLGNKIREQSKTIMHLTEEKEQMLEQVNNYQKQNNQYKIELEESHNEAEKFKALQNHSSHQQVLLSQLRSRLDEHEMEQDQEMSSKMATIEDLHNRLKQNIDNIQQLNSQLNSLQKDNQRLRSDLEREIGTRQTLEVQIDNKERAINNMKSQLEANKHLLLEHSSLLKDPERATRAAYKKVIKENGIDPHSLDKNYWIQRVGEMSIQLEESSDYWSEKVRDLSQQLVHLKSVTANPRR